MLKFSDKSNPNQPTRGPSIYRHPKKDEEHHALQSTSEALQLSFGNSKSSDFQGSKYSMSLFLCICLDRSLTQESQNATITQPQMLIFSVSLKKKSVQQCNKNGGKPKRYQMVQILEVFFLDDLIR